MRGLGEIKMVKEKKKENKKFEVIGVLKKRGPGHKFTKTVFASTENYAKEKVYALIGSKHKLKRRNVVIKEVKIVK